MAFKEIEKGPFYGPNRKKYPEFHINPAFCKKEEELKSILRNEIHLMLRGVPREIQFVNKQDFLEQFTDSDAMDVTIFDRSDLQDIMAQPRKERKSAFANLLDLAKNARLIIVTEKPRVRRKTIQEDNYSLAITQVVTPEGLSPNASEYEIPDIFIDGFNKK